MSEATQSRPTWPAKTLAALSVLAIIDAIVLTNTHAKLLSTPDFSSFCNISAEVSCDSALASIYSKLLGVPVSLYAIVAYALMLGLALLDLKSLGSGGKDSPRTGNRLFALAGVNLAFSLYMAGASAFDLRTLCLLCAGLYLIALIAIVAAAINLPEGMSGFVGGLASEIKGSLSGFGAEFLLQGGALALVGALVIVFNTSDPMAPPKSDEPGPAQMAHSPHGTESVHGSKTAQLAPEDEAAKRALQLENLKKWMSTLPTVEPKPGYHTPKGAAGAPIQIVEFADFECPACGKAWELLRPIYEKHKDIVEVNFRHFPLSPKCNSAIQRDMHVHACGAATAAVCAEQQGKFWGYADLLFSNQRNLSEENFRAWAKSLDLDLGLFETCMKDPATVEPVKADIAEGLRVEVNSTPTIIINNRKYRGFDIFNEELFELMLEAEGLK